MRGFLIALLMATGIGLVGLSDASAAPAANAGLGAAAEAVGDFQPVWWDRYGRWHPNRVYAAPRVYYGPPRVIPICRSVRVCGPRGCYWTRRCY